MEVNRVLVEEVSTIFDIPVDQIPTDMEDLVPMIFEHGWRGLWALKELDGDEMTEKAEKLTQSFVHLRDLFMKMALEPEGE